MVRVVDAERATARLVGVLREGGADLARPSRLPGWTVGHVVAHVALNAEAFVRVAADRRTGRLGVMYPHGVAGRTADIEALAGCPAPVVVDRLDAASTAFAAAWRDPVPDGSCCTTEGLPEFAASTVLLRRLREVEVHSVDTGLEVLTIDGWSDAYVDVDLPNQWPTVALRTTAPVAVVDERGTQWSMASPSTRPTLTVSRRRLLGWLLDRAFVPGLPALAPWGDQSRWGR